MPGLNPMLSTLKIVTINTSADQGGAAAIARGLHEQLNKLPDVESVFIAGRGARTQDNYILNVSKFTFLFNVLVYRIFGREGFLNVRAWINILDQLLNWSDVIHLHNAHGYYLPYVILKRLLDRPVVWTLHDYWLLTGRCAVPNECTGYKNQCKICQFWDRYPSTWHDYAKRDFSKKRELIEGSKAVFVTPSHVARQTVIDMGMPASRVTVIENPLMHMPEILPIQDKLVARNSLLLPSDKKIALFVSNKVDEPGKGFSTLIKALQLLESSSKWLLVVIGNASNTIISSATENVLFLGPIKDHQILFRYFMAADIFVNPSLSETFGLVNIESLACGCPVVCSDLPVFRELDHGGMNFFESGNAEQLAEFLSGYDHYTFPADDRLLIASAARKRFSLTYATEQYIKLYKRVNGLPNNLHVKPGKFV